MLCARHPASWGLAAEGVDVEGRGGFWCVYEPNGFWTPELVCRLGFCDGGRRPNSAARLGQVAPVVGVTNGGCDGEGGVGDFVAL